MKYRLKSQEVEAIRHIGPNTLNVVGKKGEQRAQPGDFVVITGNTPQDREVVPAKDFYEKYEVVKEDGDDEKTDAAKINAYGKPHFDTIEEAQAEAMLHYAPEPEPETPEEGWKPKSAEPFTCTIGNTAHLYAIQPSGVVAQIPVAMQDSTADFGYATPPGAVSDRFPATLANQNASAHDTGENGDLPVSPYQRSTAAEETPASTMGQVDNQVVDDPDEHPKGEGSPHEEN